VIAIHFVAQPWDGLELVIELEDFVDVAQAGRVNFKLDHFQIYEGARESKSLKRRCVHAPAG
jgi:hypothetical protein